MKTFNELDEAEKDKLLKFPAYVSLLATNADGEMDDKEKAAAIKLTHIKTFSHNPLLSDFYKEEENVFFENIEKLDQQLPKEKKEREEAIKKALAELEPILDKLGEDYAAAMHKSMKSYIDHVSHAHRNVLQYFIIPLDIKGLTD
jgi:hypothetical protein